MDFAGTDPDTHLQPSGYYVKKTEKNVFSEEMIFFWNKGIVSQKGITEKQVSE